jgi:hypothetical protein
MSRAERSGVELPLEIFQKPLMIEESDGLCPAHANVRTFCMSSPCLPYVCHIRESDIPCLEFLVPEASLK